MIKNLFDNRGNSIPTIFLFLSLISVLTTVSLLFINGMYGIFPKALPSGELINSNTINTLIMSIRNFIFIYTSLFFLSFYLIPRLTGKTFSGLKPATAFSGLILGIIIVSQFFSFESKNHFGISYSLSIILMVALILFSLITAINFIRRAEKSLFISGYFLLASLISLVASAYSIRIELKTTADLMIINSFFASSQIYIGGGFASLCIIFFLATKGIGGTLENNSLSYITLWGYLFLFPWVGFQFYFGSFLPNWLENIAIYMSLGLIVPLLAFLPNIIKTIQSSREEKGLILKYLNYAIYLFVFANLLIIVGGVPSVVPLVSFTIWSEAISWSFILSLASGMLGLYYYSIPKLMGREYKKDSISHYLYIIGSALVVVSLASSGIVSGYMWTAGANAGTFTTFGEGYALTWKAISQFYYLSTLGSAILTVSIGAFFINTLRTLTSGIVVAQEVLTGVNDNE